MTIENPFENQGHEDDVEKEVSIENTSSFREVVYTNPEQAEAWLEEAQHLEQYDSRWLDHRQNELVDAYCQKEDWVSAKRITEKTKDPDSKAGRIAKIERLSGLKYEEIN